MNPVFFPELHISLPFRYTEFQLHPEQTALIHLAGNINGAAHQLHNAFRNCHPQARTLDFIGGTVFCSGKCVKNSLQIFRRHSVSVIFHFDAHMLKLRRALPEPDDTKPDITALRRILDGIGKQIDQNLIDSRFVSQQPFISYSGYFEMKFLASRPGHRPDNGIYGRYQIIERKLFHTENHFPALNLGHVQHIIDQVEQMLS